MELEMLLFYVKNYKTRSKHCDCKAGIAVSPWIADTELGEFSSLVRSPHDHRDS